MAGRFVITALQEFPSNIKLSPRKRKKEKRKKKKGIDKSKIEETKTTPSTKKKNKKDHPFSTHAAITAGLCPLFFPPLLLFYNRIMPIFTIEKCLPNAQMERQLCRP